MKTSVNSSRVGVCGAKKQVDIFHCLTVVLCYSVARLLVFQPINIKVGTNKNGNNVVDFVFTFVLSVNATSLSTFHEEAFSSFHTCRSCEGYMHNSLILALPCHTTNLTRLRPGRKDNSTLSTTRQLPQGLSQGGLRGLHPPAPHSLLGTPCVHVVLHRPHLHTGHEGSQFTRVQSTSAITTLDPAGMVASTLCWQV